jgi:hypothetical protein
VSLDSRWTPRNWLQCGQCGHPIAVSRAVVLPLLMLSRQSRDNIDFSIHAATIPTGETDRRHKCGTPLSAADSVRYRRHLRGFIRNGADSNPFTRLTGSHKSAATRVVSRYEISDILSPMSKPHRTKPLLPTDTFWAVKRHKTIPHQFALDAIAALSPTTRPMFGCLAVYVADKIVLILRDKRDKTADNGVWLATTEEHHDSLRREFPNMRSIQVLGKGVTGWQVLAVDTPISKRRHCAHANSSWPRILESARCRRHGGHQVREPRKRHSPRIARSQPRTLRYAPTSRDAHSISERTSNGRLRWACAGCAGANHG